LSRDPEETMSTSRIRRFAAIPALALLAAAGAAFADRDWRAPTVVTRVCSGCHGIDGVTQLPFMPRLAGQNVAYLEQQLAAFQAGPVPWSIEIPTWLLKPEPAPANARTGRNVQIYMAGPAHALTPDEVKASAQWYAAQPSQPGWSNDRDPLLIEKGRELYAKGNLPEGVIACYICHGSRAEGSGDAPRLAGQNAPYIVNQFKAFVNGDRPIGSPMHGIAKDLTPEEAQALAAYLQSL
jgi:cytochrome c553